jgi:KDO2-lipid IV(A) lauroyltransferase
MYLIADLFYGFVYYGFGYRKAIVMKNLSIAFPEKTEAERIRIAKDFYHNFIDMIFETIKMFSITNKELQKRFSAKPEVLNDLYDSGQNVQLECGHFFNWEIVNLNICLVSRYPFIGVYQPLSNKVMDRLMLNMRQKNGTILIPASDFKNNFSDYVADRYAMGLAADQNPPSEFKAHWVNFFGRLTPFVVGPEKGAREKNTAVVFGHFYKVKRGYFRVDLEIITTTPNDYKPGQLTQIFAQHVERAVRKTPANYLWSHRRWKWEFDPEKHGDLVVR